MARQKQPPAEPEGNESTQTEAPASAYETYAGKPVTKHKVGLYAAADLGHEQHLEIGDWVKVTVTGQVTSDEHEPVSGGAMAHKAKVTVKHTDIVQIPQPDDGQIAMFDKAGKVAPAVKELVEHATSNPDDAEGDDLEAGAEELEENVPHTHDDTGPHAHQGGGEPHDHESSA